MDNLSSKDQNRVKDLLTQITPELAESLEETFRMYDTDGLNGFSPDEIRPIFESFPRQPTDQQIDDMVKELDSNGDGTIHYHEFVEFMVKELVNRDKIQDPLRKVFEIFDSKEQGLMSQEDIKQMMTDGGEPITDEEAKKMLEEAKYDEDEFINFKDFFRMMKFNED